MVVPFRIPFFFFQTRDWIILKAVQVKCCSIDPRKGKPRVESRFSSQWILSKCPPCILSPLEKGVGVGGMEWCARLQWHITAYHHLRTLPEPWRPCLCTEDPAMTWSLCCGWREGKGRRETNKTREQLTGAIKAASTKERQGWMHQYELESKRCQQVYRGKQSVCCKETSEDEHWHGADRGKPARLYLFIHLFF